jgi:hypothetical protein
MEGGGEDSRYVSSISMGKKKWQNQPPLYRIQYCVKQQGENKELVVMTKHLSLASNEECILQILYFNY